MRSCIPRAAALVSLAVATLCTGVAAAEPPKVDAPAGRYKLDPNHSSLTFRVLHNGLSYYTARFTGLDATLDFDPRRLESSKVTATVDPKSVETDYPGKTDFDAEIAYDANVLDAKNHPAARFTSRSVRLKPDGTLDVLGDLTLRGVTRPLTLNVRINGAKLHPLKKIPVIGTSIRGSMQRSQWGVSAWLPTLAADEVRLEMEVEFQQEQRAARP